MSNEELINIAKLAWKNSVTDISGYKANLAKLASSESNAYEITNIYSLQEKLNDIADMDKFCYYDEYVANGGTLNKMKYRKTVRVEAQSLIEEEILPLRQR